jgi:hypothetical protein
VNSVSALLLLYPPASSDISQPYSLLSSQELGHIQRKCAHFSLLLIQEELNVFLLGFLGSETIFASNLVERNVQKVGVNPPPTVPRSLRRYQG